MDTVYTYLYFIDNKLTGFTDNKSINKRIFFDNEEDEGEYVLNYSITTFIIHLTSIYLKTITHKTSSTSHVLTINNQN